MVAGAWVSATIELRRVDRAAATRIAVDAISGDRAYTPSVVGDHAYQFSRVYRPKWATVTGWIFTVGLLGAGFWLFLIKRTETCNVTVGEERALVKVTVTGHLLPATYSRLRADLDLAEGAISPSVNLVDPPPRALPVTRSVNLIEAAPTEPVFEPSIDLGNPTAELTVARPIELASFESDDLLPNRSGRVPTAPRIAPTAPVIDLTAREAPSAPPTAPRPVIDFGTGDAVHVDAMVFVGRDPLRVDETGRAVRTLAVSDPTGTVSKTHFAMGAGPAGLWVEDLHSTNGTAVGTHLTTARRLTPGERVAVTPGHTIFFGNLAARVLPDDDRVLGSAPPSGPSSPA